MAGDTPTLEQVLDAARALAARERARCLWFMRDGELISGVESAVDVLEHVSRNGGLEAFREAERLKTWLSRLSSARS